MDLQQLMKQFGGGTTASSPLSPNEQWIAANENQRALRDLLELELKKQQREEEAAKGVMDLVSGYGTPAQRAEQLYAPRPQLAQALSQFGGSLEGLIGPSQPATIPSFTDFGSPGQAFAKMPGGENINLGMKGLPRTSPEELTGINREIYRKSAGVTGQDPTEIFKRQKAHDVEMYERSLADQATRDARLEKQQAQQTAENEKKAALAQAAQDRKERAQFMDTNKQMYIVKTNQEDTYFRQTLVGLQADLSKGLTKTDRERISSAIQDTKATWEAQKRLRPSLQQVMREAISAYEAIRTGKVEEPVQEDVGISAARRAIVSLSPEDQSTIVHAYELTPEHIAAEATKRGWTPEQVLKTFLLKMREGISPSRGEK